MKNVSNVQSERHNIEFYFAVYGARDYEFMFSASTFCDLWQYIGAAECSELLQKKIAVHY